MTEQQENEDGKIISVENLQITVSKYGFVTSDESIADIKNEGGSTLSGSDLVNQAAAQGGMQMINDLMKNMLQTDDKDKQVNDNAEN